jgi:hypothetical protein
MIRTAYLDEAGTSALEPTTVVAGIVADDRSEEEALRAIEDLLGRHIPEPDRNGLWLHATDIFSGHGYFRGKDVALRKGLLEDLLTLPRKVGLAVVFGFSRRTSNRESPLSNHHEELFEHARAYIACVRAIQAHMEAYHAGQAVQCVAEAKPGAMRPLAHGHELLKREDIGDLLPDYPQATHITGRLEFSVKGTRPLLQIADACAFAVRRYASDLRYGRELYAVMTGGGFLDVKNFVSDSLHWCIPFDMAWPHAIIIAVRTGQNVEDVVGRLIDHPQPGVERKRWHVEVLP